MKIDLVLFYRYTAEGKEGTEVLTFKFGGRVSAQTVPAKGAPFIIEPLDGDFDPAKQCRVKSVTHRLVEGVIKHQVNVLIDYNWKDTVAKPEESLAADVRNERNWVTRVMTPLLQTAGLKFLGEE